MPIPSDIKQAEELKTSGNNFFKKNDYTNAIHLYTRAITLNPKNPAYYTNRALCYSKLLFWPDVINDCHTALSLEPNSLKAYTYLGLAQLELDRPLEALEACKRAYELSIQQRSPSSSTIASSVLKAKKRVWEVAEDARLLRENETLEKLLGRCTSEEEREVVRGVWARANPEKGRRRVVPDYFIDNITFAVMVDPVVTKHGQSYDRATLLEHLKRSKTDPLTREPLSEEELRPNLALREACEEFLRENGWAVDW